MSATAQLIARIIMYIGAGAVLGAILFCVAVQIPGLDFEVGPGEAAKIGALVGGIIGLVFGITRRFQ